MEVYYGYLPGLGHFYIGRLDVLVIDSDALQSSDRLEDTLVDVPQLILFKKLNDV